MTTKPHPAQHPIRTAPNAPGTLGQQFAAIVGFLSLPAEVREDRREDAWGAAMDKAMPHRTERER